MKTLILVRHAKSDWNDPMLSDFERTLNPRGMQDAPEMAKRFVERGIRPELIITSPAVRALTTCQIFAKTIGYSENQIQMNQGIYDAGAREVMEIVSQIDESINTAMLFGHNPAISNLATYLSSIHFGEVPTCSVICIEFQTNKWGDILKKTGKLNFFDYPKNKSN